MSTILDLTEARNRGIGLPADDTAAQNILDETEAWLARRIGLLEGERTETFYVGLQSVYGRLGLQRFTDAVDVVDANNAVDAAHVTLVDKGASLTRTYSSPSPYWTGPYVAVTYTPNDLLEVTSALYSLAALDDRVTDSAGDITAETIGSYSYVKAAGFNQPTKRQQRAAIVASLLPKREQAVTLSVSRKVRAYDPVINRAEVEPSWPTGYDI